MTTPGNSSTEDSRNGKETAERSWSDDSGFVIEIEEEHGTEGEESGRLSGAKKICSGAPITARTSYPKNPDSPQGNELDLHSATS